MFKTSHLFSLRRQARSAAHHDTPPQSSTHPPHQDTSNKTLALLLGAKQALENENTDDYPTTAQQQKDRQEQQFQFQSIPLDNPNAFEEGGFVTPVFLRSPALPPSSLTEPQQQLRSPSSIRRLPSNEAVLQKYAFDFSLQTSPMKLQPGFELASDILDLFPSPSKDFKSSPLQKPQQQHTTHLNDDSSLDANNDDMDGSDYSYDGRSPVKKKPKKQRQVKSRAKKPPLPKQANNKVQKPAAVLQTVPKGLGNPMWTKQQRRKPSVSPETEALLHNLASVSVQRQQRQQHKTKQQNTQPQQIRTDANAALDVHAVVSSHEQLSNTATAALIATPVSLIANTTATSRGRTITKTQKAAAAIQQHGHFLGIRKRNKKQQQQRNINAGRRQSLHNNLHVHEQKEEEQKEEEEEKELQDIVDDDKEDTEAACVHANDVIANDNADGEVETAEEEAALAAIKSLSSAPFAFPSPSQAPITYSPASDAKIRGVNRHRHHHGNEGVNVNVVAADVDVGVGLLGSNKRTWSFTSLDSSVGMDMLTEIAKEDDEDKEEEEYVQQQQQQQLMKTPLMNQKVGNEPSNDNNNDAGVSGKVGRTTPVVTFHKASRMTTTAVKGGAIKKRRKGQAPILSLSCKPFGILKVRSRNAFLLLTLDWLLFHIDLT